jgi:hypothetical protein
MSNFNRKENKKGWNLAFFQLNFLPENRRASIGETLTWVVATLVIVGIMAMFVLGSIGLSKVKEVSSLLVSDLSSDFKEKSEILGMKTFLAFELNNANKEKIEAVIK